MANIAVAEACPIDIDVFAKSDHFKKFSHFVLMLSVSVLRLRLGYIQPNPGCPICASRLVMPRLSRK